MNSKHAVIKISVLLCIFVIFLLLLATFFTAGYNRDRLILHTMHGLRTPREEIAFTARPKIHSHSQIFRYGGSIFCLPHRPIFSDILDLCLHWVSVVRGLDQTRPQLTKLKWLKAKLVAVCAISSLFQMSGLMVH